MPKVIIDCAVPAEKVRLTNGDLVVVTFTDDAKKFYMVSTSGSASNTCSLIDISTGVRFSPEALTRNTTTAIIKQFICSKTGWPVRYIAVLDKNEYCICIKKA